MKQWVVGAALCLAGLLGAVVAITVTDDAGGDAALAAAQDDGGQDDGGQDDGGQDGAGGDEDRDDEAARGHGPRAGAHGPPPWVVGPPPWAHGRGEHDKKAWKQDHRGRNGGAWRDLSEEERSELMRQLARRHALGMRRWAECVKQADPAARADCERPLPPGQAKKAAGR